MAVTTPHLATPFRLARGRVAVVEQDSIEDISQCVEAALSTPLGSLVDAPEFGVPDELFRQLPPDADVGAVVAAVEDSEPRAAVIGEVEVEDLVERVLVRVGLRS